MKLILLTIFCLSSNVFGTTPERVIIQAERTLDVIDRNAYELSNKNLIKISKMLANIRSLVRGDGNSNGNIDQEVFRNAYKWAYSTNGLNTSRSKSQIFATKISKMINPSSALFVFKDSYSWAYSTSGMNASRDNAYKFSLEVVESTDFERSSVLSCFKESYKFAYSTSGMNLSRQKAYEHAQNICL